VTERELLALVRSIESEARLTTQGHVQWVAGGKKGGHWKKVMAGLAKLEREFLPSPVPALGPIRRGGKSLLAYQLTHNTDNIPYYPAVDDNWGTGAISIAPENLTIISPYTSANPGAAFYAKGVSGIRYWVGHCTRSPRIGTKFVKGQELARTVSQAGAEHQHWGINVELLIGARKQLLYGANGNGPDYTVGAPAIGVQLKVLLDL
jgi:hypothetical protein